MSPTTHFSPCRPLLKKYMKTQLILTLFSKPMLRRAFGAHFNHGVHGFLPFCPFAKKHMNSQLIFTIPNLHLFSYL